MTQIRRHTGSAYDIVARQFVNFGGQFEQQRQWLSDATARSENGHFGGHAHDSSSRARYSYYCFGEELLGGRGKHGAVWGKFRRTVLRTY